MLVLGIAYIDLGLHRAALHDAGHRSGTSSRLPTLHRTRAQTPSHDWTPRHRLIEPDFRRSKHASPTLRTRAARRTLSRFAITMFTLLRFTLVAATAAQRRASASIASGRPSRIRLGYFGDARPFSFNGSNGPDGYAVALCTADREQHRATTLTARADERLEARRLRQAVQQVSSGEIDILCAPTSETPARRRRVVSIPIFAGGDRAVIRADAAPTLRNALAERQVTQPVWRGSPAATVIEQTRFVVTRDTSSAKWLESRRKPSRVKARSTKCRTTPRRCATRARSQGRRLLRRAQLVLAVLGTENAAAPAGDFSVIVDRLLRMRRSLALPRGDDDLRLLVDRAQPAVRLPGIPLYSSTRSGSASSTRRRARRSSSPHSSEAAMIERSTKRLSLRALVVDDELNVATAEGRASTGVGPRAEESLAIDVVEAGHGRGWSFRRHFRFSAIHALLVDWTLNEDKDHAKARVPFSRSSVRATTRS